MQVLYKCERPAAASEALETVRVATQLELKICCKRQQPRDAAMWHTSRRKCFSCPEAQTTTGAVVVFLCVLQAAGHAGGVLATNGTPSQFANSLAVSEQAQGLLACQPER